MRGVAKSVLTGAGLCVAAAVPAGTARGQIDNPFTRDHQGWRIADFRPFGHLATDPPTVGWAPWSPDGNPGGCIRVGDVVEWTWVSTSSQFWGDRADEYGGVIAFDIRITATDNTEYPLMALRGFDTTLYYRTVAPPVGEWYRVEIPLEAGGWRVNGYLDSSPLATEAQVRDVLASIGGVFILTEWATGPDDTYVDNFRFGGVRPECAGDYDRNTVIDAGDITAFLNEWFAGRASDVILRGDFDTDGVVTAADITAFLSVWFRARGPEC